MTFWATALIDRCQAQNQHLVRWHYYISLPRPSDHGVRNQQRGMAKCVLGEYRIFDIMLAPRCRLYGRNNL